MSDQPDRTVMFRAALADISTRDGCEAALDAAAATLAHYSALASVGMMRQRELILMVPNSKVCGTDD
ncbi:MAG: hypothetical protein E5V67_23740 [Mesorhizobium sp.]|uniref:hypothetical protein n=2 Tax=unclassified Mesorhizobium TaxID=325217 RepID=UPI000FE77ED1|nr:hypothetical protein [Mesorhizobium sp.]RWB58727.1 MAG: hypothetical protein EOQ48_21700 [Mesorhizobium sp.]RWD29477.1 MAG: hypothetical protein EOS22_08910 [Mesorhizobium sp.]TIU86643.1 MAG: hypothetical protein E5W06_08855 [Mesorhizobium sp.]TKB31835.1 MAG: hypothetical protein E5V67_23740 [Mesorhizobium sp.]